MEQLTGTFDWIVVGRMVLTLVLCGMVGFERSTHERASGLRPHILVGLGACLMTQVGAFGFDGIDATNRDPMRVASYVVSGIGFLGAGAILRHGTTVRGLTTAASIWGAAGIGIAVGAGMGGLAAVTAVLVLFTLTPMQRLEARLRLGPEREGLVVHVSDDHRAVGKALAALGRLGVPVKRATMLPGVGSSAVLRVDLGRRLAAGELATIVEPLLTLKCVERVETTDVLEEDDEAQEDEQVGAGSWGKTPPKLFRINSDHPLRGLNDAQNDEQDEIGPLVRIRANRDHTTPGQPHSRA